MAVTKRFTALSCLLFVLQATQPCHAAVLPEDRSDALYHSYDGGGVTISGPSILVRKGDDKSFSVFANYYVDSVSSASIDVVTTASPYREERTETTVGVDYLRDKTTMSLAYTSSTENDFDARSMHFSISQDMFGDLTTVSMGYSQGWDTVGKNGDNSFSEEADRKHYRVGISQVVTKNMIIGIGAEIITDSGFLNNPYRTVRYIDSSVPTGYSYEPEAYPATRTSTALALRTKYFLPYRAALHAEYRKFSDDWGIDADTYEVGYTHPLGEKWIIDAKYRFYSQEQADFYSDLYPFAQSQNFLARDKELSSFSSHTIGTGISYEFINDHAATLQKGTLNLRIDHIRFDYDNFRDLTFSSSAGSEPLYGFTSNVIQLFVSVWY